ncbi:MAG: hypothetical protein ACK5XB_15250, partial [Rhodospirillales bacterium]
MRAVAAGHVAGIHCWDHVRWQDGLARMALADVRAAFAMAQDAVQTVIGKPARTAGAAGWQPDEKSQALYDEAGLDYGSDARGTSAFVPVVGSHVFATPQIPTTLPTLDELIGRPEYPLDRLVDFYLDSLVPGALNAFTGHAELEGMQYLDWFAAFLAAAEKRGVVFVNLADEATIFADKMPRRAQFLQGSIDGRSGTLALQGPFV